jgi:hypothetical protein
MKMDETREVISPVAPAPTPKNETVRQVSFGAEDDVRVGMVMRMREGARMNWRVTAVDRKARIVTLTRVPWEEVGLNRKERRKLRKGYR